MPSADGRGAPFGNKNGLKKNRLVGDALRRIAVQNKKKLRAACEKLLDQAVDGDIAAFREFRDTLDGRPTQAITGPDGGALEIRSIERVIVESK